MPTTMAGSIEVREGRVVEAIWSRWQNEYVYEGCPLLLQDGNICTLSVNRQRRRSRVPAHYHRDRSNHVCCFEGRGVPLYGFFIRIQGYELQVWERCGTELLGLSGLEFARTLPHWWQKNELCQIVIHAEECWCPHY